MIPATILGLCGMSRYRLIAFCAIIWSANANDNTLQNAAFKVRNFFFHSGKYLRRAFLKLITVYNNIFPM
jgi:hypothetical protein